MRFSFKIIMLWMVLVSVVSAAEMQSLQSIRDTAQQYAEGLVIHSSGEVEVSVGQLDRRLRLRQCEVPLEAYLPNHAKPLGNITIGVRCEGVKPWSLLIPTSIKQYLEVVIAARPLGRKTVLRSGDVALSRTDISRLNSGYYASLEEVYGMVLKRSVKGGTVMTGSLLVPAILIKRNEKVIIRAETSSIQVKMEGVALESGAKGDVIEVKNLSSKQVVEAVVVSPGVVQVRM